MDTMMNQRVALPVLLAGLLGVLWGCTPPAPIAADKTQEVKIAQLERDLKTSQDASMKTGAQLRLEQAKAAQLERERDDLQLQLKQRINERDSSLAQYDAFRKNLKELIGQADSAAASKVNENSVTVLEQK
jgi:septal ring factor EnvC (AmiA/AmiB activator)